jgi:hypothetical protein
MAKGRMLSAKVGKDRELNSMSIEAELVFLLTIPHLDRDGLIDGDPIPLWGEVAPRRMELLDKMPRIIQEWIEHRVVVRYESKDGAILFFPGFRKHNQNLAYEREPKSEFPPPPEFYRTEHGLIPKHPDLAGHLAQHFDPRSRYHQALMEASQPLHENLRPASGKVRDDFPKTSGKDREDFGMSSGEDQDEDKHKHKQTEVEVEDNNNISAREAEPEAVVVALQAFGFKENVVALFRKRFDDEYLTEKMAYATFLAEYDPKKIQSPTGWLRRAIEEDYAAPDGYAAGDPDAAHRAKYSEYNHLLKPLDEATP